MIGSPPRPDVVGRKLDVMSSVTGGVASTSSGVVSLLFPVSPGVLVLMSISFPCLVVHSYRSASIGSSDAARFAG